MTKEYNNEVNRWKLKSFFMSIFKEEASRMLNNNSQREELAELLATKLLEKITKETRL